MKALKFLVGYSAIIMVSLACTSSREMKREILLKEKPLIPSCIYKQCDSLLPRIDGVDSLLCAEYTPKDYDTVYFNDNVKQFVDSTFMQNIIARFSRKHVTVLFTNTSGYPRIMLEAIFERCTYKLKFCILAGHLGGRGWVFELIKVGDRYKIGKVVGRVVS